MSSVCLHSKSNELSSPVIHKLPPWNYQFIKPTQLSSVFQKSSSSSPNTTHDLQASSIPGLNSPYPSNTMPPPPTNDGKQNIYGCMVDVSKLTPAQQQQQHAVILLEHYHELCNTNDPSSKFFSPPPIPNIESFSQSAISSLDSG